MLIGLTRGVAESIESVHRALHRVQHRYHCCGKWCVIERVAAHGASVRLFVKPSKAATDFLAAAKALRRNKRGVKRSASALALLSLIRRHTYGVCALPPNEP